jgi:hypothetical protein
MGVMNYNAFGVFSLFDLLSDSSQQLANVHGLSSNAVSN